MQLDWKEIDRFLFGSAWTDARISERAQVLCEEIGPRWATSPQERRAAEYICGQFAQDGLEKAALEDDRHHLDDEQAAGEEQREFLAGGDGDEAQRATEGERAGVAHENRGREAVEPQEPEGGARKGGAEDGQLAGAGNVEHI